MKSPCFSKSWSNVTILDIPFMLQTVMLAQSVKLSVGLLRALKMSRAKLNKLSSTLRRRLATRCFSPRSAVKFLGSHRRRRLRLEICLLEGFKEAETLPINFYGRQLPTEKYNRQAFHSTPRECRTRLPSILPHVLSAPTLCLLGLGPAAQGFFQSVLGCWSTPHTHSLPRCIL